MKRGLYVGWALILASACSGSDDSRRLQVGHEGAEPGGGAGTAASHGGQAGNGNIGSGDNALTVHVEDEAGMTVELVTLACAGDCADIEAVARGGNPPYAFAWEDGSTNSQRHVCLDASTTLSVTATDTKIDTDEFEREAQSATVQVTAAVLDCSDGGPIATGDCDDAAQSFVADDIGKNPVGATVGTWSYGYTPTLGGAFKNYPTYYPVTPLSKGAYFGKGFPEAAQWFDEANGVVNDPSYAKPAIPDVLFNPGPDARHPSEGNLAGNQFTLAPMQLALDAGAQGELSVVRWTATHAGTFVVSATFTGLCGDNGTPVSSTSGHVLHNGTMLDTGYVNLMGGGNELSITRAVAVEAGDTLDFALGNGGNTHLYDFTALDAKVCEATR